MTETIKTVTFVAVALAIALIAWISRPSMPVFETEDMVGRPLFPDFDDPLAATSLEIFEYDESTATVRPFKVAQVADRWSIPSHANYPADAKDHLAEAAAGLMGLTALTTESDSPGDHEHYGVVDPDPKKLQPGATGVGTRVTMRDKNDRTLLSLIIGRQVPGQDGLRYVRRTGQDQVFAVALKTDRLSTRFRDWIEEDLLKLNSWDIKRIEIHDYSIDEVRGTLNQRGRMTLEYNDTGDPRWNMAQDTVFVGQKWVPQEMALDEELDTSRLDDVRTALDNLEIVDVNRKPEGLSADLAAGEEFINNPEAVASLQSRGFYRARVGDRVELFSNEGEIRCLTDEGVKYILRFGQIAGVDAGSTGEEEPSEEAAEGEETDDSGDDGGVNRFLFVMAEFDDSIIEKPELEPLPEKPQKKDPDQTEASGGADQHEPSAEDKDDEADENDEADAQDSEADEDEQDASEDGSDEESEEEKKKYQEELERVEKENKRKQEEYDQKLSEGREKVDELNARFADWYYIISDQVYQQIHLSREDIVKKKEKDEDEDGDEDADEEPGEGEDEPTEDEPEEPAQDQAAEEVEEESAGKPEPDADQPPAEAPTEPEAAAESEPDTSQPTDQPAEVKPADAPEGSASGAQKPE